MKALINVCIYDFEDYREDSYVLFHREIEEVGRMEAFPGADEIYDCRGKILMPGLVNCHTHIYSIFARGMNVSFNPKSFLDILEQLWWKLDGCLDKKATYYSGLVYGCECIKNGVTSVIDHHASGLEIRGSLNELKRSICDELGMRGIFCFETSDRFHVKECIEENLEFAQNRSEQWAGLFGMHASMTLSNDTLKRVSSLKGDIPIHIHVAESKDDVLDCFGKHTTSIVKRLNKFGLLNHRSILAHCVHISEEEAEIIGDKGCRIAINPTSNMNNAVGLGNYEIYRKFKIPCMVGNDGLGTNITRDYLNMVFSMKNRLGSPTKFDLEDLIHMINNGYEYVGNMLNIKVGKIKKGYVADMITLEYTPATPINKENMLGHVFFGIFDNFIPRDTWVSGKCLMKDSKLRTAVESIYGEGRKEAEKVWERVNKIK